MKVERPIYLNLWRIRFPITAIVSILHRISGVVIFLGLPLLLYLLGKSLNSQESYNQTALVLGAPGMKLAIWIILSAIVGHFFAGIRHLLMDTGLGESLKAGRISAWLVLIISILIVIILGLWIWS
ncbi:MAG: succinate dehydrogenase, cytochrome b556 subunit [Proteobacteria bacterium]|nr:succinate dehydrogenase, cytochrome b556 subunit [Pseudomonadota bacterium]